MQENWILNRHRTCVTRPRFDHGFGFSEDAKSNMTLTAIYNMTQTASFEQLFSNCFCMSRVGCIGREEDLDLLHVVDFMSKNAAH